MDKMINAYKSAILENYANFSGRLSVPGYWWFFLANFIIGVVLQILLAISGVFLIFLAAYGLATLIPSIAAGIRRLHDTGKSGWFLLIALIPFVGTIVLIVFLASKGDQGSNQYGPPPVA